jgi:hypothetical protein
MVACPIQNSRKQRAPLYNDDISLLIGTRNYLISSVSLTSHIVIIESCYGSWRNTMVNDNINFEVVKTMINKWQKREVVEHKIQLENNCLVCSFLTFVCIPLQCMQLLPLRTLELKTVAMFTSSLYMFCHKSKKLPVQQRKYRATSLYLIIYTLTRI